MPQVTIFLLMGKFVLVHILVNIQFTKGKYYSIPEQAVELSNLIKNKDKRLGNEFVQIVKSVSNSYENRFDILFKRVKQYKTTGRLHNENQSGKLYNEIKDLLDTVNPEYEIVEPTQEGYEEVIE